MSMNIAVLGLWHLGSVTAACCAKHFHVMGLDFDEATVVNLNLGKAPLFEPGLDHELKAGIALGRLGFSTNPISVCPPADVLWVCYDTPVNDRDESDVAYSFWTTCAGCCRILTPRRWSWFSSQLPVGTCAQLEKDFPRRRFAYSPENLRLGKAIDSFEKAERVVVGIRHLNDRPLLEKLFAPFTWEILFMRTESAEMVKHALNSFLALSVTYINEIARLCERVGADAKEVSAGLKSDPRIGPRAYLGPGGAFAGGTLARDVVTLTKLAESKHESISVILAIKESNDLHRDWALRRLQSSPRRFARKNHRCARPHLHYQYQHLAPKRSHRALPKTFGGQRKSHRLRSRHRKFTARVGQNLSRARHPRTCRTPMLWLFAPSGPSFVRPIGRS